MKQKKRIDDILVERLLSENTKKSLSLIMAGKVYAGDKLVKHAGERFPDDVEVKLSADKLYVSRAGIKLDGALKALGVTPKGKICMDIGASTGGFTDCLLQFGALKVYALDVGKNLLDQKLLNDSKVIPIESTNFRFFSSENLKERMEFVTIDVSFISITKILPNLKSFLSHNADIIAMVKPQFEAPVENLSKGVLKSEALRQKVIAEVKNFIINSKFKIIGESDSALQGPKGNIEHFLHLQPTHE